MKKNILIIENDEDIRQIVSFVMDAEGYATLSMPEPQQLDELSFFKPDLILLDEFINSKPGHRLCRRIKHVPELATVPVIILSTANDIELIARECEANDFIRKPFDVDEMTHKVQRCLDHLRMAF